MLSVMISGMIFSFKNLLIGLFVLSCCAPGRAGAVQAIDPAAEAGFVPHKALYDVELSGTKSGSQIVNISGQMLYEWQPGCDAWISNHRFNLAYEYADSPALHITSDFSIYEPFDEQSMSFTSQRKRDGYLFQELRGQARLAQGSGQGEAIYTKPEGLSYDLPEGALFPMAHSLDLLKNIRAGKKFYKAVIFDGSDEDGPVEVNAFIGKTANPMAHLASSADIDPKLVNVPAHNIRLAFFPLKSDSLAADYEMSIIFHENGVISDMMIEYDNFSVTQKLVALEVLGKTCGSPDVQEQ